MPQSIIIHEATNLKPGIYQKLKDFLPKSVVQIAADTNACPVFKEEEQMSNQIERIVRSLERLTLIIQKMIDVQANTSKGLLALGKENEALRNRVTELEEICKLN